jgi:hypothetical protein
MKFMIPEKLFVNIYFKKLEYDYVGLVNRYRIPDNNKIVKKFWILIWIVFPWEKRKVIPTLYFI